MESTVLIADGNSARAHAIARACGELELSSRVVPHGAAALEAALSDVPGILLADRRLPLIEPAQLAEILRTNPRTEAVQLVLLGAAKDADGPADVPTLDVSMSPADIAESLRALHEKNSLDGSAEVTGDGESTGGVDGELVQLALTDLLQLFHVSRKTGTIALERTESGSETEQGRVVVSRGEVIHSEVGRITGEKALFRLIAWMHGSFTFRPGPVEQTVSIQAPTLSLLREGRRQVSEWKRLAGRMPPMDAHATLTVRSASLPNVIHPLTQEVLLVLENFSRIRDVVDHCSYPDYQVLRMLHTLIRRGMLWLRRDVPGRSGSPSRAGLFSPTQASRMRAWLDRDGSEVMDAKLVVASAGPEASREFARAMGRLPGVDLAPDAITGETNSDTVAGLGRIAVDAELGIEFVQVPVGSRFAPLWPIAADGAIAVLLVLAGPLSNAVETIREVGASMRALPRSRVFYMLLLEKGQGIAPDELGENIALLDETSLFLIPQENDLKARILLREMFGRIVP